MSARPNASTFRKIDQDAAGAICHCLPASQGKKMALRAEILDYYRTPGPMTSAGRHGQALASLPASPAAIPRAIQGVLLAA